MSLRRCDIESEISKLDIDSIVKNDDKYAQFPLTTVVTKDNAIVYRHPETILEGVGLFSPYIDEEKIEQMMVMTSVHAAILLKKLEMADSRSVVASFYTPLSAADELSRTVLEASHNDLLSEQKVNLLLDGLQSGQIMPDIARINSLRLNMNLALSSLDLRHFEGAALGYIENSFDIEQQKYGQMLEKMGTPSPLAARNLFANSIQALLLATAFPMANEQVDDHLSRIITVK